MAKLATCAILALFTSACATVPSQAQIDALLKGAIAAAQAHQGSGSLPEAAVLLHAIERVDPDYPGVQELAAKLSEQEATLEDRGWLGVNRRLRARDDRPFLFRLLLYVPDRLFDALDLFTFDVHVGFGAFANIHATRALQVGGGLRSRFGVGLHEQRSIGASSETEIGVAAVALGTQSFAGSSVGVPGGVASAADSMAGMHWPSDSLYQDYRDYWAIGASVTVLLVGAEFDFHPVQIFDFIGGIFLLDFAHDDLATTRALRFTPVEFEFMVSLNKISQGRIWKGVPEEDEAPGATPDG